MKPGVAGGEIAFGNGLRGRNEQQRLQAIDFLHCAGNEAAFSLANLWDVNGSKQNVKSPA